MTDFSVANFLRKNVYPKLDAVQAGLFDGLKPRHQQSNGSYPLVCPACKAQEGYYYPHSGYINCPRTKECGNPTSIWDALIFLGHSHKDIFLTLCKAAGVEPPPRESNGAQRVESKHEVSISQAIIEITQRLAKDNPQPLKDLQNARRYTDERMAEIQFGYYTTAQDVLGQLKALGFTQEQAVEHGYVERSSNPPHELFSSVAGRVIGYWPHPDGAVRLWGRIPVGSGDKKNPKYRFARTLKKTIPYLFNKRQNGPLICVEGGLDAWALQHLKLWGVAIGGAHITSDQADFFVSKGIDEVCHMVDGDIAGWEGAIQSIRACEPRGITTSIIALGAGMDDADAMVSAGKGDQLKGQIEERLNAGTYLALMLKSLLSANAPDMKAIHRIYTTASTLTTVSSQAFQSRTALLGIHPDLQIEAARLLGALVQNHVALNEALSIVKRKTGYTVTFTLEQANG